VQSGFWLVLPEKSDSGFPVVNPAYEAAIALRDRRSDFFQNTFSTISYIILTKIMN
jgi:hypothetical protein